MKIFCLFFVIFVAFSEPVFGWRNFWKGRRFEGNVGHPTKFRGSLESKGNDDLWFTQKLDHFTPMNDKTWKQVWLKFNLRLTQVNLNELSFLSAIFRQRRVFLIKQWPGFYYDRRRRRSDCKVDEKGRLDQIRKTIWCFVFPAWASFLWKVTPNRVSWKFYNFWSFTKWILAF